MTEEDRLQYQLGVLFREYEKAAKPIIDRLVAIRSMKPVLPMNITYEQWSALQKELQ